MPTAVQVVNRRTARAPDRHYPATVVATGPPLTVALDPGGVATRAAALGDATYTAGQRVLVLVTAFGNFIINRLGA